MKRLQLPRQTGYYQGKVRDVYMIGADFLVMIVSDRISAFDVVLPRPIPFKGQVLNQIATYFLDATRDLLPNWAIESPVPHATIGYHCRPFPIEMVVRGYLSGHAWRVYQSGQRKLCGVSLPEGLHENDPLPNPILTPTTKAKEGHDEDISRDEIIQQGLVDEQVYEQLENYAISLFSRGQKMADQRGLILVDTKYEFGWRDDKVFLIDEIHTPDSSRYFYRDGFEERQRRAQPQKQLSKEFVREWLMSKGFQGKKGQEMPEMTDEIVLGISQRYIELFEQITGREFEKKLVSEEESEARLHHAIASLPWKETGSFTWKNI